MPIASNDSVKQGHDQSRQQLRAQRFPIHTPMHYRLSGEDSWSEGNTINISRSGVLFLPEKTFEPGTVLEMCIVFPSEVTGDAPANIFCHGSVVRKDGAALAASILRYHFTRE